MPVQLGDLKGRPYHDPIIFLKNKQFPGNGLLTYARPSTAASSAMRMYMPLRTWRK